MLIVSVADPNIDCTKIIAAIIIQILRRIIFLFKFVHNKVIRIQYSVSIYVYTCV